MTGINALARMADVYGMKGPDTLPFVLVVCANDRPAADEGTEPEASNGRTILVHATSAAAATEIGMAVSRDVYSSRCPHVYSSREALLAELPDGILADMAVVNATALPDGILADGRYIPADAASLAVLMDLASTMDRLRTTRTDADERVRAVRTDVWAMARTEASQAAEATKEATRTALVAAWKGHFQTDTIRTCDEFNRLLRALGMREHIGTWNLSLSVSVRVQADDEESALRMVRSALRSDAAIENVIVGTDHLTSDDDSSDYLDE